MDIISQELDIAMERVTTLQAAHELNMDITALTYLMIHDRLPIGYAIKRKQKYSYYIYRGMLDKYKQLIISGEITEINIKKPLTLGCEKSRKEAARA